MTKNKNTFNLDKVSEFNNVVASKEKQLLLEAPTENLEIVKAIHLTHHLNKIEEERNKLAKYSHFKEQFESNVYSGADIKKLCNTYDLKLCRAEQFKGDINSELIEKINQFYKAHEYEIEKLKEDGSVKKVVKKSKVNTTPRNFYILAPSECFLKDSSNCENVTLFYREHSDTYEANEQDMFVEVHTWGNNYSELRKIKPYLNTYKYDYNTDAVSVRSVNIMFILLAIVFSIPLGIYNQYNAMFIMYGILGLFTFLNCIGIKKSLHYKNWNINSFSEN